MKYLSFAIEELQNEHLAVAIWAVASILALAMLLLATHQFVLGGSTVDSAVVSVRTHSAASAIPHPAGKLNTRSARIWWSVLRAFYPRRERAESGNPLSFD